MNKNEFLEKYKDLILSHELRILKKNEKFYKDAMFVYENEKKLSQGLRHFRNLLLAKQAEVKTEIEPNLVTIKKKMSKCTKIKLDIDNILEQTQDGKCEVIAQEETTTTESKSISKIVFHSHYAKDLQPVIKKLTEDSKSYLKHLQSEHVKDSIRIEKDINKTIKDWQDRIKPLNLAYIFFQERLTELLTDRKETEHGIDLRTTQILIENLCKLVDKISRIENTLIYKTTSKYDIREKQTKEISAFVDSLVKMQMTIKGIIDNDVNIMQNGYLTKEVEHKDDLPPAIVELYKNTSD